MVREAFSAGGQPQQAEDGAAGQPLDLRSSTANLTQELSQLLAASIAQGQADKRLSGTAAAGAELANLAALVSASQNQRNHQPAFRDGLSSLSYARPAHAPPPPPPAPTAMTVAATVPSHPAPGLLVEPHDEEPMPIPSTWRQPTLGDDDRWYRQQLGAAALGLVAGLIVVVPAVLWLSGWLGGAPTKAVAARHQPMPEQVPPVKVAEVKQVKVTMAATEPRAAAAPPPAERVATPPPRTRSLIETPAVAAVQPPAVVAAPRPDPAKMRAEELMAQARRLIESGDIPRARAVLDAPETAASAPMMFMLAETYDPNMLASWQTRGIIANPERARALYQRARDLGDGRAQQRLDWLTGN